MDTEGNQLWGDLERRRPTKRLTTFRNFNVVRNWNGQSDNAIIEKSVQKVNQLSAQSTEELSRVKHSFSTAASEPISAHDVVAVTTNNDAFSPLQTPVRNEASLETSLPGAASVTPLRKLRNVQEELAVANEDSDDEEESGVEEEFENCNIVSTREETPQQTVPTRPSIGLHSGTQPAKLDNKPTKRSAAKSRKTRATVTFKAQEHDSEMEVDDEQYEAHNLVRLFNADRGRKGNLNEVTDLDVILTNIEEIALEMKNNMESYSCKKAIREMFTQCRQVFSNSVDIYMEKKHLDSANRKENTKMKKMKHELLKVQAKRRRMRNKREKLQAEYDEVERQRKEKKEAYTFLREFEDLQEQLRTSPLARSTQGQTTPCLSSLLHEAGGYLSTNQQLVDINDKLRLWLHSNRR